LDYIDYGSHLFDKLKKISYLAVDGRPREAIFAGLFERDLQMNGCLGVEDLEALRIDDSRDGLGAARQVGVLQINLDVAHGVVEADVCSRGAMHVEILVRLNSFLSHETDRLRTFVHHFDNELKVVKVVDIVPREGLVVLGVECIGLL
jgi:hypothetical protein